MGNLEQVNEARILVVVGIDRRVSIPEQDSFKVKLSNLDLLSFGHGLVQTYQVHGGLRAAPSSAPPYT